MTAALVSIISRVITSQQFFLYNPITFISVSITRIPVPATHIPTINISNNQYPIPAIIAFGIFVLICATDCPASIVQPIKERAAVFYCRPLVTYKDLWALLF